MKKKKILTPGKMLLEQIEKHNTNINAVSKKIGVSQTALRLISLDEARITTANAINLSEHFKVPARDWLIAQMEYDLSAYGL